MAKKTKRTTTKTSRTRRTADKPAAPRAREHGDSRRPFTVSGTVRDASGAPVDGAIVVAYDKDMRSEQVLGQTRSRDGRYTIAYTSKQFARAEKGTADLRVAVVDKKRRELVSSEVRFNAGPEEVVDLQIDAPATATDVADYQRLVDILTPLTQDVPFAQLTDKDITFLAGDTGEDRQRIAWLSLAAQRAMETAAAAPTTNLAQSYRPAPSAAAVPPEAFYAWFRQDVPTSLDAVWSVPTDRLIALLRAAIERNIVPRRLGTGLDKLAKVIDALKVERLLQPAPEGQRGSLGDLLATMPTRLSPSKERAVADALRDPSLTDDGFVKRLKKAQFDASEIAAVRATRALGDLVSGHVAMVGELQALRPDTDDPSLRFLAPVTSTQWLELAYKHQATSPVPGSPDRYAEQLERSVEEQHPTAVLAARIRSGHLDLHDPALKEAADVLAANPQLELRGRNARMLVDELGEVAEKEVLASSFQRITRARNLADNWREAGALLRNELDLSMNIVAYGAADFRELVAGSMSRERADAIYAGAQRVHDTTIALVANTLVMMPVYLPGIFQIGRGSGGDETETADGYPNLQQLFGNLTTCECDDCQSVLSPAAYLVDLLRFLHPQTNGPQVRPPAIDTLLARRPDIADLELTCKNTKTEIPYIDLVLEILENAIALPIAIPAPYGFDPAVDLALSPIPPQAIAALRTVLERSAISVGDSLQVEPSPRKLLIGTFTDWLITDGARHWTLRFFPQSLTGWRLNVIRVPLQVTDYAATRTALDQVTLPTNDWVIPPDGGPRSANLPLQSPPTVTVIEAGRKWEVAFTRAVRVSFTMAAPISVITLRSVDGQQLSAEQYQVGVLQRVFGMLQQGGIVEPLLSMLPEGLQYQITRVGNDWEISASGALTVAYTPEQLQVVSLTYQTSDSREDLLASPENRNPAAYDLLDGAVFPWTLPFNLWIEEVRVFLERRGIPRRRLMEECTPAGRLSDAAIAREVLGVSLSESAIIDGTGARPQWDYWGLQQNGNRIVDRNDGRIVTGSWSAVLGANVSILLQQSGLNYRELLNVLQTQFVRAESPVLAPQGDECNPSRMRLVGLRPAHLDRIHRMVRLWRKRGGSLFDLDLAIAADPDDPTTLNGASLVRLANLQRLHELLGLPLAEIAAWWGIWTTGYADYTSTKRPLVKSVYERLFLNPTLANPPDRAFILNPQGNEILGATPAAPALASRATIIAAALGITQADLDQLVADLTARQELDDPPTLTLANLAALFRHVSLAKALRLSIPVYRRLRELAAADPFASAAAAVEFVERARFVAASGFTVDALHYLLRHTIDDLPTAFMTEAWASAALTDVRNTLQTIHNTLLNSADTVAANLRRILSAIGWYDELVDEAVDLFAVDGQLSVQVPAAPAVTIPAALANRVTYRTSDGTLTGSLGLTAAQWSSLNAANLPAVRPAITVLRTKINDFANALPALATRLQSFDLPIFSTAYSPQSPPVIPRELAPRCYFDAVAARINFRGWMTAAQEALLATIVPAPIAADLRLQSDQYVEGFVLNMFLANAADVRALFAIDQTPDTRVRAIAHRVLPYLYRQAVAERLGAATDVDPALITDLLARRLDRAATLDALLAPEYVDSDVRVTITGRTCAAQFRALCKVHKAALIYRTLGVTLSESRWLPPSQTRGFDALNVDTLPSARAEAAASYQQWQQLVELFRLRDRPQIGSGLLSRLLLAMNVDPARIAVAQADETTQLSFLARQLDSPVEDVTAAAQTALNLQWPADYQSTARMTALIDLLARLRIARALQLSADDVAAARSQLGHNWPADVQNPFRLSQLVQLLTTVQRLGASASESVTLTVDAAATAGTAAKPGKIEALLARKLLRARYDEQSWPQQLRPITDSLRHRQRDALVAYLIAHPPQNAVNKGLWKDANDVYEHYLIDPQMSACRVSSRILHAISAVQLFMQRCSMNLEDVSPAAIDPERLKWSSNYRVWEANRKVFLYPENWLESELRDVKSEPAVELEGQLQQSELDETAAQDILKGYLKQLEDIAHLAIVGMYVERVSRDGGPELRVHLVGRTRNRPSRFYYRCWIVSAVGNRWLPWEHIALEGVKSDHILPFVLRGDVYITWPEMTQLGTEPVTAQGDSAPGAKWRVQMAWSRRTNRGWSDRLLSSDVLEHPWVYGKDENQTFTFRVRNTDIGFADIDCYGAQRDDDLIYSEDAPSLTPSEYRTFVPMSRTSPWIRVQVSGTVYGSYSNGTVLRKLGGAQVRVYLKFNGSQTDQEAAVHDRAVDFDTGIDGTRYGSTDENSTLTNGEGYFATELALFALMSDGGLFSSDVGFFRATVMRTDPTFEVEVSYPDGQNQTASFTYKNPASTQTVQYFSSESFQQNFIVPVKGAVPGGEADRPVTIVPLRKFRIYTADDAEFLPLLTPLPPIPPGVLTFGSGFKVVGASPGTALQVADSGNTAVTVWTGVAPSYSVLPAAPFDGQPPSLVVYRDAVNAYLIRRQAEPIDPPSAADTFQVLVDGHPRAGEWRRDVGIAGLPGLFDLAQQSWQDPAPFDVHAASASIDSGSSLVRPAIRFEPDEMQSPYAYYNTELFLHVPLLFAGAFTRNQHYAQAQGCLRFLLDPTTDETGTGNARYWRYRPFREHSQTTPIDELLRLLADPNVPASDAEKKNVSAQIDVWSRNPFRPHAIAQLRPRANQFTVVFKWLDNTFSWADMLFRRYTTESINEATQLYMLIAKFLGPRPQSIPGAHKTAPLTYRRANNQWDQFSNLWVEIESNLALRAPAGMGSMTHGNKGSWTLSSIGLTYFCVPRNTKLLEYWDRLENRLFNIRHCRNIDGLEQEVPPFAPPIDPGLLVRATAAGLDIAAVLADTNTPLPYYRFNVLMQRALELCNEVKGLSGALLAALEKKDAEQLALLRSTHEIALLKLVQEVRDTQIAEAIANIDALNQSEKMAVTRFKQYQRLLGSNSAEVPEEAGADIEQASAVTVAPDAGGDLSNLGLTRAEQDQIGWSETALRYGIVAGAFNMLSGILFAFPDISAGTPFFSTKFGGTNLGYVANSVAALFNMLEQNATHQSTRSGTIGQHQRRQDEWIFQSRLALQDVQQIRKQIITAHVRLDIATKELANHKRQVANSEEADRFMREKYTNRELYHWMTQQLAGLCFRTYQLAFEAGKRAERAFREELGVKGASYLGFGYWDTLKKGLLAGEQLGYDLRRMEAAYLDQNRREYEITKNVSLLSLDPVAVMALRETGTCEIDIPEVLFDLEYPGHYLRRLKSVGLTIPCVTGPYSNVSCTLELLKSAVRQDNAIGDAYQRDTQGDGDPRFRQIFGRVQSIVTSHAQQDSGLFETNLRDERYLPFEGAGAISTWRLSMPVQFRQFDYATIADVILHMRYTSRDGGVALRNACASELSETLNAIRRASTQTGLMRLFSLKQEFPGQWHRLTGGAAAGARSEEFALAKKRFPFLFASTNTNLSVASAYMYLMPAAGAAQEDVTEFPTIFLPKQTPEVAAEEAAPTTANAIGRMPARKLATTYTDGSFVAVTEDDDGANWRVELASADVAGFRKHVADVLLLCHYNVT